MVVNINTKVKSSHVGFPLNEHLQLSLEILPRHFGPEPNVYEPNGEIQVEVTALNNSYVGLLAVDKAVYLLRNKDRMGKQKVSLD